MEVKCERQIGVGGQNEDGTYLFRYEYDIYRFIEADVVLVARSYVDQPEEVHFLSLERRGNAQALSEADVASRLAQEARRFLQQRGMSEFNWLSEEGYLRLQEVD